MILEVDAPVNLVFITIFTGAFFLFFAWGKPAKTIETGTMKDENWAFEWLRRLTKDVEHLTIMIYGTKKEIKSPVLKDAREDLENVFKGEGNQTISSRAVIDRLRQVREKLESAGLRLELVEEAIVKNKSNTRAAAKRARRLAARIRSTIGLIKKALNEKGDLPME